MRAYLNIWGKDYLLNGLYWSKNGSYAHVTFDDESGVHRVVHRKMAHESENEDEERDLITLDIESRITWKEK